MQGINKVILIGNLGADPEMKYTADGRAIANFNVATSERWRDKKTGEQQEKTEWHRIVMFGRVAEVAGEFLTKGSPVYLEGKLQTRKWQDSEGTDRWTTEVVASQMQMLGKGESQPQKAPAKSQSFRKPPADDFDQDLPF